MLVNFSNLHILNISNSLLTLNLFLNLKLIAFTTFLNLVDNQIHFVIVLLLFNLVKICLLVD
jgi:hypothetical protein